VVREALRLERQERERENAFGKRKAKLERGAQEVNSENLLDGDEVFEQVREIVEEYRAAKAV
jgi:hypothetical protein